MVFGLFDRWKSKNILAILLVLHTSFLPSAYAYDENDGHDHDDDGRIEIFDDEPFVITPGEDTYEGHIDGDCVGSGCDERDDDRDGGYGDYDDDGPSYENDDHEGSEVGHNSDGHGRQSLEEKDQSRTYRKYGPLDERPIDRQDADRGDGTIIARDIYGNIYYRGEPSEDDYFDHTDIYETKDGVLYVKSTDNKKFLPLNGIKDCAIQFDCGDLGYREDWWNYSYQPAYKNAQQYYWKLEAFSKVNLEIKSSLKSARAAHQKALDKLRVLDEVEFLQDLAKDQFHFEDPQGAAAYQAAALEILKTVTEIGIGVSPLGWGKDVYELITGKSILDGRALSRTERVLAAAGVVMPGVAGLAFAGIKIVARHPLTKTGINSAVKSYDKISDLLGSMKVARFKEGKNLSEVAVIGRDMGTVREAADRLELSGIKVIKFDPSSQAMTDLDMASAGGRVPYEMVPNTQVYKENMQWVSEILRKEVTVIDIGNPKKSLSVAVFTMTKC